MSTLFLQLTQVLMLKNAAARKISTLNELKQNDDVHVTCQHLARSLYSFISALEFWLQTLFFLVKRMVKRAFISIAPPRECVYLNTSEFFFLPCSSNTRMEGVWCNNVLTPGVDISLFGKHCSWMLFCQPPINNESKRRLM